MTRKGILALLCAGLLVYSPLPQSASAAATPTLGQVIAKGDLKINGATTPSGATVYSGDEVETGTNAEAELVFPGEKVLLPQTSAVALNNEAGQVIVNLKQGSLAVLTKSASPVFIDANGVRIKPAANTAIVMEVAVVGNSFKVLMRRGSAAVETSSKTLNVPEGKELDATTAPDPAPTASQQVPAGGTSSLATWELIVAAAAGVTGLIMGAVALSRPNAKNCTAVSPSGTISCP